jgi:ABC-type multidrug transport system fused ATPase/permease subunit
MYGPSFARVLRFCPVYSVPMLFLWAMAVLSVASLLALLVVLGGVAHLLLSGGEDSALPAADPLLIGALGWSAGPAALWNLLLAAAILGGVYFVARRLAHRAARENALWVSARLRHDLHRQTLDLGGADVLGRSENNPVQLFTVETGRVQDGLAAWWDAVPGGVLAVVACVSLAVYLHPWLALSATLLAVLLAIVGVWLAGSAAARQLVLAERSRLQMSALVEGLKHSRLVIGYQLDDTPGAPFAESMPRYLKQARALLVQDGSWRSLLGICIFAGGLLLLGLIGVNRLADPPQLGAAESLLLCAAIACAGFEARRLLRSRNQVMAADHASEAIFAYLQREPRFKEYPDTQKSGPLAKDLRLEDILLRDAAGQVLLEGVTLTVPAKGRVAVVASDRTAALALACLFPRFYDPDAGRVLYDGQDLRSLSLRSLRGQMALVPQDGLLFTASVLDNITCGDFHFTEADVRQAAKLVGADEVIDRLPQGFATTIGEHGIRLSPGESLLVGLSRAVLRSPSLLIVEEPEQDLEPEEAACVNQALNAAATNRTLLTIATRLETLRSADYVYLLHEGRLLAEGSHADLLQTSEFYRHLLYLRFNEFRQRGATQHQLV